MRALFPILAFIVALTAHAAPAPSPYVGIYRVSSPGPFKDVALFIVTSDTTSDGEKIVPDYALYVLTPGLDDQYTRSHELIISNEPPFTLKNDVFAWKELEGTRVPRKELPEQLRRLAAVNEALAALEPALSQAGFKSQLGLQQQTPVFSEAQALILAELRKSPGVLVDYLKRHRLSKFYVTDYLDKNLQSSKGSLHIPAGIPADRYKTVLTDLKNDTNIDR